MLTTEQFLSSKAAIQPNNSKATHYQAVKAIVQAAINLEEFTIPLYMCSMYSLTGTHQITGRNNFYQGRWWPGAATTNPTDNWSYEDLNKLPKDRSLFSATNNKIFNLIFKVFIEEMLHLQLAGNMAKALGLDEPTFTHEDLVDNQSYAWKCYGKNEAGEYGTTLPYIIDLRDTIASDDVKVKLGPLDENQIKLFQAIEIPEERAKANIKKEAAGKYFPSVPFKDWTAECTIKDLPMFGSIGHLYTCLWQYITLEFEDGTLLIDYIIEERAKPAPQQNIFVYSKGDVEENEYSGFPANLSNEREINRDALLCNLADMINAITEQGEGSQVADLIKATLGALPRAVSEQFQVNPEVLNKKYQSRDDIGNKVPSRDANARAGFGIAMDHDEIFIAIEEMMTHEDFQTWDMWHANPENKWTRDLLAAEDYQNNQYQNTIPAPEEVAAAMNRLKLGDKGEENYAKLCKASSGAIWGIVHVLNGFWSLKQNADRKKTFPYPSMAGSGDRMATCWAVFGKVPDISIGLTKEEVRNSKIINHACQGMNLDPTVEKDPNDCAHVGIYHTCKGSNTCRGEGGCGFVQDVGGSGGGCSMSSSSGKTPASIQEMNLSGGCGAPVPSKGFYSAPADNNCGGTGGCAVPISASQIFPAPPKEDGQTINIGKMQLFDMVREEGKIKAVPIKTPDGTEDYIYFQKGSHVYDIAWEAYSNVLKHRGTKQPEKPEPSDIRLAFPPST